MTDPHKTTINVSEIEVMARTIWGEARGESLDGKRAVAEVILNRVLRQGWMGKSVEEVCLRPQQFSCWNDGDPNQQALEEVTLQDKMFRDCVAVCVATIEEFYDPTFRERPDVCHYHSKEVTPAWAFGHDPYFTIGNHIFYAGID